VYQQYRKVAERVPNEEREWLSIEDFARELGVPIATVYAWRHKGTGPRGIKVGRHVRYRRRDVERWLESRADQLSASA